MSIHNARSEAMNVKSLLYTPAIVHARKLPNIIFHPGRPPLDAGRARRPANEPRGEDEKAVLSPLPQFLSLDGVMQVARQVRSE